MAGILSKNWSYFNGHRNQSKAYVRQDSQANIGGSSSRVNLQERFSQEQYNRRRLHYPRHTSDYCQDHHSEAKEPHHSKYNNTYNNSGCCCDPYSHLDENGSENHRECFQNYTNPRRNHPHHSKDHFEGESHQSSHVCHTSSTFPRRPLHKLPSGIAPLWNSFQESVSQLKPQTSRIFQEGDRKVNRALQGVRTSISSLKQMFRNSTRRRYKLGSGTPTRTPGYSSVRTPGRLYSPFNISTPVTPHSYKGPKRLQNANARRNICGNENWPMVRTPQHHIRAPQGSHQFTQFHSPSQSFQRDVLAVSQGLKDFEHVSSGIPHNGREKWIQF